MVRVAASVDRAVDGPSGASAFSGGKRRSA